MSLESPRSRWLAVAAIVALGLALRLAGIGDRLSDAEGYSWLVGSAPDLSTLIDRLTDYENTPPLFYVLLSPLPLDDEAWIRLPALLAGAAIVGVVYLIVRPAVGTRTALLAALIAAVAPYHVSYSNYSRGFMLAGLGLMLALWAIVRLNEGRDRRWWGLYVVGGVIALYSEYDAAFFLFGLLVATVWLGRRPRGEIALLGAIPFALLALWLPWFLDAQDSLDVTKISPTFPAPSPNSLRDVTVALTFGEHGAAGRAAVRWLQFLLVAGALAGAALLALRRDRTDKSEAPPVADQKRRQLVLTVLVASAATVGCDAFVAVVGPDLFNQRYMTSLIPVLAILVAVGVSRLPWRPAVPLVGAGLLALGLGVFVQRAGRELEPSVDPARPYVEAARGLPVLTNSAVVAFYLRDANVTVDRPFGLGTGHLRRCRKGCIIVEDTRVPGGVRPGLGPGRRFGPFVVAYAHR